MAIDRTGQVTTTGLMGGGPKLPKAPDMSGLSAKTEAPPRKDVPPEVVADYGNYLVPTSWSVNSVLLLADGDGMGG